MAQLTWREVSAPDLSSAARGYQSFSDLLGRAISGLEGGLDRFDASQTNRVNNQLALEIAGAADAEAAKEIAAGLATRPDARRVSAQTAALAAARPGQLINQAAQEQALDDAQYMSGQVRLTDQRAPLLAQARAIAQNDRSGTGQGLKDFYASNPGLFAGLGYKTVNEFMTDAQNDTKNAVGIGGQLLDQSLSRNRDAREAGRYNFELEDRKTAQDADEFYAGIIGSIDPNNPDTIRDAMFNGGLANASGRVRAAVYGRIANQFPGVITPGQLGLSSADFGTSGGESGVPGLVNSESGGRWNTLNGEGYGGRLQFGTSRLADAANAGVIPKGTTGAQFSRMSPEQQMRVENWHFADIDKKSQENGVARSIGRTVAGVPITRDSIRSMAHLGGIDGVKRFIETNGKYNPADSNGTRLSDYGRRFSGSGQNASQASMAGQTAGARLRDGQDRVGKVDANDRISAAANGPTTVRAASDQLRAGAFKGVNYNFLNGRLNDLVEKSKVNGKPTMTYGEAAMVLDGALMNPDRLVAYANENDGSKGWFSLKRESNPFNEEMIRNEIERSKSGGVVSDVVRRSDIGSSVSVADAAQVRAAQARNALARAAALAPSTPGIRERIDILRARSAAADAAALGASGSVRRTASPQRSDIQPRPSSSQGNWITNLFTIRGN